MSENAVKKPKQPLVPWTRVSVRCTWAEHVFDLVDELLCHQVCKAPHAQHPAIPLAGDALQTLILLNLVEHVSDSDGTHVDTLIPAHMHQYTQMQAMGLNSHPAHEC